MGIRNCKKTEIIVRSKHPNPNGNTNLPYILNIKIVREEIASMLEKKAKGEVNTLNCEVSFISPIFLVEKKGWGQRPSINRREVNGLMVYMTFQNVRY